jgi:hypothetical protein
VENEISQNGSEKVQHWLHNDHSDDVGSQIRNTAADGRRNEQNAEVKSFCDAAGVRKSGTIGVQ